MTRPSITDAPARPAATGRTGLWAVAVLGLVLGALLLVAGLPQAVDASIAGDRPASMHAVAAMASSDALGALDGMVAETDAWAEDSSFAAPLPPVLLRVSRAKAGFHPCGRAVAAVWNSNLPHRPPRRA